MNDIYILIAMREIDISRILNILITSHNMYIDCMCKGLGNTTKLLGWICYDYRKQIDGFALRKKLFINWWDSWFVNHNKCCSFWPNKTLVPLHKITMV